MNNIKESNSNKLKSSEKNIKNNKLFKYRKNNRKNSLIFIFQIIK